MSNASSASPASSASEKKPAAQTNRNFGGLIAILIAIVIGVLVGVFYGRQMWLASGEVVHYRDQLEKTFDQKEEFAKEAEAEAEAATDADQRERLLQRAERLRSHKPIIQERIEEIEALEAKAEKDKDSAAFQFAGIFAILTEFVGDIFLQVLKLLVIPLVVTSMICGITSLGDIRKIGRMGGWTIGYYVLTMAVAVFIGIALVTVIEPGKQADDTFSYVKPSVQDKEGTGIVETLLNVFRGREGDDGGGMFPSNIFQAATNTNVLALIVFAIIFGGALTTVGEKGATAIAFFEGANEAVMKMVHLVMLFAPVGIYGLVAWNIAKNGGGEAFYEEIRKLGWYVATVLIGLSLHVVFLCFLLTVLGRRNPFAYVLGILRALLTAMTTASSSATLPVTIECVEDNNGVSNRSASFVAPLGATVNMDGTALYEAVAVIFIAQSIGMQLPLAKLVVIFFTATLAAVGAAGIPEAGLVTMVIVLQAAGVPISGIGTILAIDWFLDRMRTTVNVCGDAIGCAIVDERVVKSEG